MTTAASTALSKSKYLDGLQCVKRLWWRLHEPEAAELIPNQALLARFAEGNQVTVKARERFPGGIQTLGYTTKDRAAFTQGVIAQGATLIYEATFEFDGTAIRTDILQKRGDHWTLIEVKSSTRVKPEQIPDAAVQLHVLRGAGLDVNRVEIMHLNRECRYPDLSTLFVLEDVTVSTEALLPLVARNIARFVALADEELPEMHPGSHCEKPHACPFTNRCCATPPLHAIETLFQVREDRMVRLRAAGYDTIDQLPAAERLSPIQQRQRRSAERRGPVVEPGLVRHLAVLRPPIAFLDFETVNPAIPVWDGCRPWEQVAVQVSVHTKHAEGSLTHREWLAHGPGDPRGEMARHLVDMTAGATAVLVYSSFEDSRIRELQAAAPAYHDQLENLRHRLVDMLLIVRDNVYVPEFRGSYSIKAVLPALDPTLDYGALEIQDGDAASAALKRLLFDPTLPEAERVPLRAQLLAYCRQDTLAMVRVLEALRSLDSNAII
jgi:predicted RecB family nuclease